MIKFTVEETNLLSIYDTGDRQALANNICKALPYMDEEMQELALRALYKVEEMSDLEYAEFIFCAAEEV